MASKFNVKSVHRDGRAELTIGIDENAKTIDGIGNEILFSNEDGSPAKVSITNIIGMPEDVSEDNKLVTQKDLQAMMKNIQEIIDAANELAKIVGGIDDQGGE